MYRITIAILTCSAMFSCQGEIDTPFIEKQVSLQEFFTKNAPPSKKLSANSTSTIFFSTSNGTNIRFPANAFVTKAGVPVTGDVNIEVQEILDPMNMILANKPTTSNGALLESGGEFYIRVTKNNEELKLAPNAFINIDLKKNYTGMSVFNGAPQADGTVNWVQNTNTGNFVFPDSLGKTKMFADSVEWINCDKFYNDPTITYSVLPGNCPLIDSTKIYLHLTGRNTVMSFPKNGISNQLIASPATIVAICVKEGTLYTSVMSVVLQDGKSVTLQFSESTEDALKRKLQTLK
ncbi:MAG: hypothetical protein ACXWCZ_08845 [Flavisolibacter sp.]